VREQRLELRRQPRLDLLIRAHTTTMAARTSNDALFLGES
jgi:hypothetical protein